MPPKKKNFRATDAQKAEVESLVPKVLVVDWNDHRRDGETTGEEARKRHLADLRKKHGNWDRKVCGHVLLYPSIQQIYTHSDFKHPLNVACLPEPARPKQFKTKETKERKEAIAKKDLEKNGDRACQKCGLRDKPGNNVVTLRSGTRR